MIWEGGGTLCLEICAGMEFERLGLDLAERDGVLAVSDSEVIQVGSSHPAF